MRPRSHEARLLAARDRALALCGDLSGRPSPAYRSASHIAKELHCHLCPQGGGTTHLVHWFNNGFPLPLFLGQYQATDQSFNLYKLPQSVKEKSKNKKDWQV